MEFERMLVIGLPVLHFPAKFEVLPWKATDTDPIINLQLRHTTWSSWYYFVTFPCCTLTMMFKASTGEHTCSTWENSLFNIGCWEYERLSTAVLNQQLAKCNKRNITRYITPKEPLFRWSVQQQQDDLDLFLDTMPHTERKFLYYF